jgi:hypothetical protein
MGHLFFKAIIKKITLNHKVAKFKESFLISNLLNANKIIFYRFL